MFFLDSWPFIEKVVTVVKQSRQDVLCGNGRSDRKKTSLVWDRLMKVAMAGESTSEVTTSHEKT